MRHYLLTLLFILTMLFPFKSFGQKSNELPDFRYPETVAKNAQKQLDDAIGRRDGHAIVLSLVQLGLSRTAVSRHNAQEVCNKIDEVLSKDNLLTPDIRSLLYLLEAHIVSQAPHDASIKQSSDVLYSHALDPLGNGDVSSLQRPLSEYSDLISSGSEWGSRAIPTLLDFVTYRVAAGTYFPYEKRQKWLTSHLADADILPRMFIEQYIAKGSFYNLWSSYGLRKENIQLYQKYIDYPESALFLLTEHADDEYYAVFKDYLQRYPSSDFSGRIQNLVAQLEDADVRLSYPSVQQSTDRLIVSATSRNVNDVALTLYRLPKTPERNTTKEMAVKDFKAMQTVTIHAEGKIPFNADELTATFDPVPFGQYIVLASYQTPAGLHQEEKLKESHVREAMINVTDIRTFQIRPMSIKERGGEEYYTSLPIHVFAVNSQTGKPLPGATVSVTPDSRYNKDVTAKDYLTDIDGRTILELRHQAKYTIAQGEDRYLPEVSEYYSDYDNHIYQCGLSAQSDLGIYRPGEELRFSVVAWNVSFTKRQPTPSLKLQVSFRDASGKEIEKKDIVTDQMGQAVSSFQIPTDRMNGRFSLRIYSIDGNNRYNLHKYIEVSEYKTPTFMVDLSDTDPHQLQGEQVKVKGRVMTYSGMPVADAEVQCRLSARAWMWWYDVDFTTRTFTVKTDKDGRFEYTCPKDWTIPEAQEDGRRPYLTYTIEGTCTNAAGETHSGQHEFWIGNSRGLSAYDATLCLAPGKPAAYGISFVSSDENEKSVRCHYDLVRVQNGKDVIVKSEDFLSDLQKFNWDKIPSGEYLLRAQILGDEEAQKAEAKVVLYRENDALPPVASSLWVPTESHQMDEEGRIRVLVGTTTGSHIYYVVSSRGRQESAGWLYYTPGLHWFTAQMPKELGEQININFYTIRDGKTSQANAYFRATWRDEAHLTAVSFRDKIRPGSHEHWTFRLTDKDGNPISNGRMMLDLYNDALNALASNPWSLDATTFGYSMHSYHEPRYYNSSYNLQYSVPRVSARNFDFTLPKPNYYGQEFYSQRMTRSSNRFMAYAASMVEGGAIFEEMADAAPMAMTSEPMAKASMKNAMAVEEEAENPAMPSMSDVAVRADEVKVALWQPQLTSDADGNFDIEFDVPNFNTTYFLQTLAYTPTLQADKVQKKVLAQRPVMVQTSLPRFLRAGDSIELAANVMNATDDVLTADVLIELFDPRSGEVVQTLTRQLQLAGHATEVVRIQYTAPMDAPYIGFRIKALAADGNGDGEQQLLPILTDITPVIETQPFYMQPQTSQLGLDVLAPASTTGSRLTLEYCNNPTWYCVTALPSIINVDAITSPALAHNLFAIALVGKLTAENPLLAEAVASWKQRQGQTGDVLVSQLQQNADLKISPLLASPWLPDAERQTLRMQALDQLFDAQRNVSLTTQLINSLQKLQAEDGGFLWLDFGDRSEASYWATSQVLELLGEIHHLGCLPDDATLRTLIAEATHYYDKETLQHEKEMLADAKKYGFEPDYLRFWSYVYTRQLLLDVVGYESKTLAKELMKLTNKTLDKLEKDWGTLDMTSRAQAAVILHRYGRKSKAQGVMESVRQFALHDPHKGMYWESLDRYSWFSPVACTSAMLQAFAEVSPRQAEIDEMREWLLLEKQTSDWGSSSLAADAVYAILSTGSDWLHASVDSVPQFEILVDGQKVDVSDADRHLGYVRMTLPADTKRVEVSRSGLNPAWGSLYHQYQAKMAEVREQRVDELGVTKQFSRVDLEGKATVLTEGDSLRVGDRVRITLKIHAAKDLEYVTLVDQRPAFLEPVDQTSHYTRSDRFYYYLETKDAVTNAFITRLPEGHHTLSYDCHVTAAGAFTSGIATIQSQYAPQFVAHSAGEVIIID